LIISVALPLSFISFSSASTNTSSLEIDFTVPR
jgi:hypothetical protein